MTPKLFVIALISLDLAASLSYAVKFDWRRGVYWLAAAVLSWVVTF